MTSNISSPYKENSPYFRSIQQHENTQNTQKHSLMKFSDKYKDISSSSESELENKQNRFQQVKPTPVFNIVNNTERNVLRENVKTEIPRQMNSDEEAFWKKDEISISDSSYGDTEHERDSKEQTSKNDTKKFVNKRLIDYKTIQKSFEDYSKKRQTKTDGQTGEIMHESKTMDKDYRGKLMNARREEYITPEEVYAFEQKRSFLNDDSERGLSKISTDKRESRERIEISNKDLEEKKVENTKPVMKIVTKDLNEKPKPKTKSPFEISPEELSPKPKETKTHFENSSQELASNPKEETKSSFEISPYDLSSKPKVETKSSYDLSSNPILEIKSSYDLSSNPILESTSSYDLSSKPKVETTSSYDLFSKPKVETKSSYDLSPSFPLTTSIPQPVSLGPSKESKSVSHFTSKLPEADTLGFINWNTKEISSANSSSSLSSDEISIRDTLRLPTLSKPLTEDERMPRQISIDLIKDKTVDEDLPFKIPEINPKICKEVLHIESTSKILSENEVKSLDISEEISETVNKTDTYNPSLPSKNSQSVIMNEYRLQPPIISIPKDTEEVQSSDQIHEESAELDQAKNRPSDDLLKIDEALRLLQSENLTDEIASVSRRLDKESIMDCFTSCFSKKSNSVSKQKDKEERDRLFALSLVRFSDTHPFHERILMSIWRNYTGAYSNCQKTGDHWKDLGFTQNDPTQQLGNSNMFGLMCMLFLGCMFTEDVIKMLDRARTPGYSFHLASVSIKMSEITLHAIENKNLNSTINKGNSAYDVILNFYGGLMIKWFDKYVTQNCNESKGNSLISEVCKYSKQHPDEVYMLAKSRFNLNKLRHN